MLLEVEMLPLLLLLKAAMPFRGVADQRGAHPQVSLIKERFRDSSRKPLCADARFLWGATDVNTGPTSVTKA